MEIRESMEMAFEVYWKQIEAVPRFTYLGRVMTAGDDDWSAVAGNLAKARKSCGRLQGVLRREGATPRISGNVFKAVVQQVLLFGAETWVLQSSSWRRETSPTQDVKTVTCLCRGRPLMADTRAQ